MTVTPILGLDRRRRSAAFVLSALLIALLPVASDVRSVVSVVVSGRSVSESAGAVRSVGGEVVSDLPLVDGVTARIPSSRVDALARAVDVVADRPLHVRSASFSAEPTTAYPYEVGAVEAWALTAGDGVGVALIDTGVAPVPDLIDRVAGWADLTPEHSFADTFGHGTFMAGLIAGDGTSSGGRYTGVAPRANLVSIKVAVSDGSTTLGTVITGLNVAYNARSAFNVRVALLALSSGSVKAPERDPLSRALRRLWEAGIFVVVPAGNDGPESGTIDSPGNDPVLITAGSVDDRGTPSVGDDLVSEWSSRGPTPWGAAKPDVAAPGAHLVSVRAPGSTIDAQNPGARVEDAYFRGSGTSMSAAVTAGVAALILSSEPQLTPDQLKDRMMADATPLAGAPATAVGAGVVRAAVDGPAQVPPGGGIVVDRPGGHWKWDTLVWNGRIWDGRIWDGRIWDGRVWDGRVWDGRVWDGRLWS